MTRIKIDWSDRVLVEGLTLDLPAWVVDDLRLHETKSVQFVILHFSAMNKLLLEDKGEEWYGDFVNEVFARVSATNRGYTGAMASIEDVTLVLPSALANKYEPREISLVIQYIISSYILMGILLVKDQGIGWYSKFAQRCDEALADYRHLQL